MTVSNRLEITELASTQVDRSVTINEAIAKLEAGATIFACLDVLLDTPPGSPAEGDLYIVGTTPTGAWATHADEPALYYNGSWIFFPVFVGMYADDGGSATLYRFAGTAGWVAFASGGVTSPASTTEQLTGTETLKYSTPDSVAALWEKGGDIASAATISIGEGGFFHVTGTTGITDIDFGTDKTGRKVWLEFDGVILLTNSSTLILPTLANITTAVGDTACFISEGTDAVRCVAYNRADGTSLAGAGAGATASTTEQLTGTSTTKSSTPDSVAALWEKGSDVASAGTISLDEGWLFHITGTTTITDIDWAIAKDGRSACLIFDGALTLTHNATTLKLPGGANITTAAGDRAIITQDSGDNVICVAYIKADGTPIVSPTVGSPFELEVAASDETTDLTTGTAKITFYAAMNAIISEVFIGLSDPSSSGAVTADLNKNGTTMFTTNPSIDATEDTNLTGTAAVLNVTTWAKGDKMTIDIDAAGTDARGLKMVIRGTRT